MKIQLRNPICKPIITLEGWLIGGKYSVLPFPQATFNTAHSHGKPLGLGVPRRTSVKPFQKDPCRGNTDTKTKILMCARYLED